MYAQVEKPKENTASADRRKSRAVANSVAQKKSNAKQCFGFVDNREMSAVGKSTIHLKRNNQLIQRQFIGKLSTNLASVSPKWLGFTEGYYQSFYDQLNSKEVPDITVSPGSPCAFYPDQRILTVPEQMLQELDSLRISRLKGDKNPELESACVSHIADITHELSHARDALISKKNVSNSLTSILDTELRAWAVEAIAAHEASKKLGAIDESKSLLMVSWKNIEISMLDNLWEYRGDNEIVNRLRNYIKRDPTVNSMDSFYEVLNSNIDFIRQQLDKLKPVVIRKCEIE